ncbi:MULTISPECIES: hypothetical protein [Streptomyces]|uniref:Serine hydrolase n=1 Tax=Streptomyces luteosporeus TaxID=173856 RepID=A0ABN3TZR7_9ACTN
MPNRFPPARPVAPGAPAGTTAAVAVFDRRSGTFTELLHARTPFRSASVVKLLIALDHLWERGPAYAVTDEDRARLEVMLRSSDDGAAGHFWDHCGQGRIVRRMADRLGLADTAPPPDSHPGFWGYTALSAQDTVRVYRYLLDEAPVPVRALVMGALRRATRCGTDGYDQNFGLAAVFDRPWAVKQGWSGFPAPPRPRRPPTGPTAGLDLHRPALHTTGTVGPGDRAVAAVLTLHPPGTPYGAACTALGRITRGLHLPGATRLAGTWLGTRGPRAPVRTGPTARSAVLSALPAGAEVLVGCQRREQPPGTTRATWWAYLPAYGGYVAAEALHAGGGPLPAVPTC